VDTLSDVKLRRPRVLLSHPGTGPFVQHAARALHEAGLLAAYVTTFSYQPMTALGRALRTALRVAYPDPDGQLARRKVVEVPPELVRTHPVPELLRMLPVKLHLGARAADLVWEPTEIWFDSIVARKHLKDADAVYGYEHACLATFRAQKARGGLCIYDMPICHHATTARWVGTEFAEHAELVTDYERHRMRLAARRNRRKDQELALADRIITASDFVAESLVNAGVPKEKIWIVPSGAPPVDTSHRAPDPGRFVFIVAGTLSVRKGTHYVLEAWRRLAPTQNVQLWLVGGWQLPDAMRTDLPGTVVIRDTVPRPELYSLFDRANVLVFPTLAEGLALTPLQAMARALPVITTPNSGAGIFIRDAVNGLLVPPCDVDALTNAMARCMEDSAFVEEMGHEAAKTMAAWQWSDYCAELGRRVGRWLGAPGRCDPPGENLLVSTETLSCDLKTCP